MVGLDYGNMAEQRFVQGDARVTVDFADMHLGVALTGIADVESGETYDDMTWEGIAMRDGTFETPTLRRFRGDFSAPITKRLEACSTGVSMARSALHDEPGEAFRGELVGRSWLADHHYPASIDRIARRTGGHAATRQ
ncbi:MAG: hypothetical protein OXF11_15295 [Deltaproteobacteria bacterium]|nr:hypothetical protein [Deltaproteobacteria bacterium]